MIKKQFPSSSINTKNPTIKLLNSHTQGISVYADKGRISQVVYNLLDNAVKFSKTSEDNVIVMIRKEGGGGGEGQDTIIDGLLSV